MEFLPEFSVVRPGTVAEAVAALAAEPGARVIAGGTDLIANIRRGIAAPPRMVDLNGVGEIRNIEALSGGEDGGLSIGAAVTLAELIEHGDVGAQYPAIIEAAGAIAANSHREAATVGGNLCLDTRCVFYNQSEWWRGANGYCLKSRGEICHVAPKGDHCFAAFSGDLAPALMVLGAEVEIASPTARRTIPLSGMYVDDGMAHLALAPGEIVTTVRVPAMAQGVRAGYAKSQVRGAIDFPLAGVAVALRRDGEAVAELTVALTGTNSMPLIVAGADDLTGGALDDGLLDGLDRLIAKQIQPMTSTFVAPGYRRRVVARLTRRLVQRLYRDG